MEIKYLSIFNTKGTDPERKDHVMVDKERNIFIVADGIGSIKLETSKTVCEAVFKFLEHEAGDRDATMPFELRSYYSLAGNILFNALQFANTRVAKLNEGKTIHEMGAAGCAAAYLDGDLLAIASVGGCSAWLFREQSRMEIVRPRTYGRIQDPFLVDPPYDQDIPMMSLGISEDLEPEITECRIRPGDWLLLQSDGISGATRDKLFELKGNYDIGGNPAEEVKGLLQNVEFDRSATISLVIF